MSARRNAGKEKSYFDKRHLRWYVPPEKLAESEAVEAWHEVLWYAANYRPKFVNGLFESCWESFCHLGLHFIVQGWKHLSLVELLTFAELKAEDAPLPSKEIHYEQVGLLAKCPEEFVLASINTSRLGLYSRIVRWSRYWNLEIERVQDFGYRVLYKEWQVQVQRLAQQRPASRPGAHRPLPKLSENGIGLFSDLFGLSAHGEKPVTEEQHQAWLQSWRVVDEEMRNNYFKDFCPARIYPRQLRLSVPNHFTDARRKAFEREMLDLARAYHKEQVKELIASGWQPIKSFPHDVVCYLIERRLPPLICWEWLAEFELKLKPARHAGKPFRLREVDSNALPTVNLTKQARTKAVKTSIQNEVRKLLDQLHIDHAPTFSTRGRKKKTREEDLDLWGDLRKS